MVHTVKTLTRVHQNSPTVWIGQTTEDRPITVLFERGVLTASVGNPGQDASEAYGDHLDSPDLLQLIGGVSDGFMDYDTMRNHVVPLLHLEKDHADNKDLAFRAG